MIQKIFEADPLICPKRQGRMRIIGSIEDPSVIRAILEQLDLWLDQSRPPPKIHNPPNIEYATADLHSQPHTEIIYGNPEYSWVITSRYDASQPVFMAVFINIPLKFPYTISAKQGDVMKLP
jgi:hypothetical protein